MQNDAYSRSLDVETFTNALLACKLHIGRPVLLSVSGGLDSMVLWHLVRAAAVPHAVAHVNFELRGDNSDADAELVRATAQTYGVPCHVFRAPLAASIPVGAEAAAPPAKMKSVQARARAARVRLTSALAVELDGVPILLAHHADDQAETLLMRMSRGTGGAGLAGMAPASPPFYRPLLGFTRAQVAAYAKTHDVAFRHDRSNDTDDYTRNALRHHVLPALRTVEPRTVSGLAKTARQQADLVAFAEAAAETALASSVLAKAPSESSHPNGIGPVYDRSALARTPGGSTLLYFWLHPLGYRSAQITTLAAWVGDGEVRRRRMVHPRDAEAVAVAGGRVYRERLP